MVLSFAKTCFYCHTRFSFFSMQHVNINCIPRAVAADSVAVVFLNDRSLESLHYLSNVCL